MHTFNTPAEPFHYHVSEHIFNPLPVDLYQPEGPGKWNLFSPRVEAGAGRVEQSRETSQLPAWNPGSAGHVFEEDVWAEPGCASTSCKYHLAPVMSQSQLTCDT
jgi:hypothetical protein